MSYLAVDKINSFYGDSHILFDVSMRLEQSEVVALLGRNGAGKSTTLKSLMGLVDTQSGSITIEGQELRGAKPHKVANAGVQLVPEERRIFGALNVGYLGEQRGQLPVELSIGHWLGSASLLRLGNEALTDRP